MNGNYQSEWATQIKKKGGGVPKEQRKNCCIQAFYSFWTNADIPDIPDTAAILHWHQSQASLMWPCTMY